VLVTNVRNFPLSGGTVAGIRKGYIGLSAVVYTVIYMVLDDSSSKLLAFLALGLPVLCLAMMYFIRACTPASGEDSSEHVHYLFTQAASVLLAIYLLSTTVMSDTLIAIMVILLMSPLAIPLKMTLFPAKKLGPTPANSSDDLVGSTQTDPLL
jgi:hypothetical protein